MTLNTKELKRLAQKATPGPWAQWVGHGVTWSGGPEALGFMVCECDPNYYAGKDDEEAEVQANATAAYIAAANPQAILALIERLETLEEAVKGAHVIAEQAGEVLRANKGTVRLTLEQAKQEQMEADCKVRCVRCLRGTQLLPGAVFGHQTSRFGWEPCKANDIRTAYAKAHLESGVKLAELALKAAPSGPEPYEYRERADYDLEKFREEFRRHLTTGAGAQPDWIPCNESLPPPKQQWYLVADGGSPECPCDEWVFFPGRGNGAGEWGWEGLSRSEKPYTHWRPIPAPPESGKKEAERAE